MKLRRVWLWAVLILAMAGSGAWAEPVQAKLTASKLRELGINTFSFRPVALTSDGLTLLAVEKTTPEERIKGNINRVWTIKVGVDGNIRETRSVSLSCPTVEGMALTSDESAVVVITLSGATYLKVPLDGSPVSTLMEHKKGVAGFRADPSYLRRDDAGGLMTIGYPYDAEDYAGDSHLTALDASLTGMAAFRLGAEAHKVERELKGFYASNYTSPQGGFMAAREANGYSIYWWQEGSSPRPFDHADRISSFWAAGSRVAYALSRGGSNEAVVYDAVADKRWVAASGRQTLGYQFLSDDGKTAVFCQLDLADSRMSILYGKESEDFKLKPVAGLQRAKMGAIRLAPNGRFLAFYNGDFLQFVELP